MNRYYRMTAALLAALIWYALQGGVLASPNASLRASVVDVQTRQPLSEVKVSAFATRGTHVLSTALTDKKGEFTLTGLNGGQYRLEMAKHGYHLTVVEGLYVKPGEHMVITGAIGMYSARIRLPQTAIARNACRDLVMPGQVADVYVVCE